jgi:hypothetical protein
MIQGTIRTINYYADGIPSVEIHFSKKYLHELPFKANEGVDFLLNISGKTYKTRLRHTERNDYLWISPDCYVNGERHRLSDVLFGAGYFKNQKIEIDTASKPAIIITSPYYSPDEVQPEASLKEGAVKQININAYERNSQARQLCLEKYGYKCSVCEMSFAETYGKAFAGYIHVHHLVPLKDIGETYNIDPVKDLRPVCPNCHAVIHHGDTIRTITDVRKMLERKH